MIQIRKQRKIIFYLNNKIDTFASYDSEPMRHEILVTNFDEITKIYCECVGVSRVKITDVTS